VSTSIGAAPGNPERDQAWDEQARDEKPAERLDRNWSELIQELRVVQTGVQFLTGFLLTLPFQQRFAQLSHPQKSLYLATVCASIGATAFLQAPVSVHRSLFRRHQREQAVLLAHYLSIIGIALLAVAVIGVAALIFDVTSGTTSATVVATLAAALLAILWLAVPLGMRKRDHRRHDGTRGENKPTEKRA
jgi:O-antigen/teichoic acid export membrane protein